MSVFGGLEVWLAYLVAAGVTFFAWYRICARIGSTTLRDLLRVVALAALFTPAGVPGFTEHLAPAWLVFLFEGVLQSMGNPLPAAIVLLVATVVLMAAVAAWRYFRASPEPGRFRAG